MLTIKSTMFLASIAIATASAAWAGTPVVETDSFDVLASVMDTHNKAIDAKGAIDSKKNKVIQYREKIIAGWWEFMQAKPNSDPGEYCAASFLRAQRLQESGKEDRMKDGVVVTLFGPGGKYRGALLGFSPLGDDAVKAFPVAKNGSPILVTLKQGNIKPVTLNAIYLDMRRPTAPNAPPLLAFAVPNIEALMNGMEDNWSFEVLYEDKSIAKIEWHDGLMARTELKKCLAGEPFDDKRHWKD